MLTKCLRMFLFLALTIGLTTVSPTLSLAEDGVSARGKKKKRKKKRKNRKKRAKPAKKSTKRMKRPSKKKSKKRTKAQKANIANAKACAATCKPLKKGSKKRKDCYKKCLKNSLSKAKTSKKRADWDGKGRDPRSALVASFVKECKKAGKSADKDGACVDQHFKDLKKGGKSKATSQCGNRCRKIKKRKARKKCFARCARKSSGSRKAFKGRKGKARIFMPGDLKKSTVEYTVSGNEAIADGCIGLGAPATLEKRYNKARLPSKIGKLFKKKGARGGSVVSRQDMLWPRGEIPFLVSNVLNPGETTDEKYTKDKDLSDMKCQGDDSGRFWLGTGRANKACIIPSDAQRQAAVAKIRAAARELSSKTALKLFEISASEVAKYPYYVDFQWEPNGRCWSRLGRDSTNGQPLKCDYTNESFPKGTLIHELLHAAGFNHTQKRTDRDDFITMQANKCAAQFEKARNHYADYCAAGKLDIDDEVDAKGNKWLEDPAAKNTESPYDLGSIMHYSSTQCATSKDFPSGYSFVLAQDAVVNGTSYSQGDGIPRNRSFLTPGDIQMIDEVYGDFGDGVNRNQIKLYCWWKDVEYADNTGSRGASQAQTRKCLKKCGRGTARTRAGRKALNCRQACYK